MDQDNQQLNIQPNEPRKTRKWGKIWDILLWTLIVALVVVIAVRVFVIGKVEVSGESMTASYYNSPDSEHYNYDLTYHNEQIVTINKLAKPKRGDVVVFYENPVSSKFWGMFARGESVEKGGEYYKLIKRVVAVGGDRLWVEEVQQGMYRLVIQAANGDVLYEDSYVKNRTTLDIECFIMPFSCLGRLANTTEHNPLVIEEGYFFAMGDNRTDSLDSRGPLGAVPVAQLFGVVI